MTHNEFITMAIQVPFKSLGRDNSGWDCYGLVRCYYEKVYNILLPSFDTYISWLQTDTINSIMAKNLSRISISCEYRPGVVAVILRKNLPVHVGITIEDKNLLHVNLGSGTTIESLAGMRVEGYYCHA